jgi:hypothetical protein
MFKPDLFARRNTSFTIVECMTESCEHRLLTGT